MDQKVPTVFIGEDEQLPEPIRTDNTNRVSTDGTSQPDRTAPRFDGDTGAAKFGSGIPLISPLDFGTGGTTSLDSGSGGTGTRRRGRPPGSKNRTGDAAAPSQISDNLILSNIEDVLVSLHFMGAKFLDVPEIELSAEESRKLTRAIKNVAQHYRYSVDPKKLALFQLLAVSGGVYGPRLMAIYRKKIASETPAAKPAPVPIDTRKAANGPVPVPTAPPVMAPRRSGGPVEMSPSQLDNAPPFGSFEI